MAAWQTDRALTCLGSVTEAESRRGNGKKTDIFFLLLLDHLLEQLLCCHGTTWLSAPVQLSKFIHHGWRLPRCLQGISLGWILQGKYLCEPGLLATCQNKMRSVYVFMHLSCCDKKVLHGFLLWNKLHEFTHTWLCCEVFVQFFIFSIFALLSTLIVLEP